MAGQRVAQTGRTVSGAGLETSSTVVLWRRLDAPGHDACRFSFGPEGVALRGCAVFREGRRVCRLDYEVLADAGFRTRRARVAGFAGRAAVALDVRVARGQRWTLDGVEQPQLAGCIDLDLAFTPATNLLPLRRLALKTGQEAQAPAAWLAFPAMKLRRLPQRYRRLSRDEYDYEAPSTGYRGTLRVSGAGVVLHYPELFAAESPS